MRDHPQFGHRGLLAAQREAIERGFHRMRTVPSPLSTNGSARYEGSDVGSEGSAGEESGSESDEEDEADGDDKKEAGMFYYKHTIITR